MIPYACTCISLLTYFCVFQRSRQKNLDVQRKALGPLPMVTLMEPYLETFLKGLGKSVAIMKKKKHCVRRFLSEGFDLVTDEEVKAGQINPETLLKLLKRVCEEENGYLHPNCVCSIKIETKSIHLAYVKMFMEDLETNRGYFPCNFKARMLAFYDIKRVLKQASVRQEGPRKLHRDKRKVTSMEEQIPVKFIEELVQSSLVADSLRLLQGNPAKKDVLQVRDSLITWICCHCVRRAEELKTFSLEEAVTSNFVHADYLDRLQTSVFTYSVYNISLGTRRQLLLY